MPSQSHRTSYGSARINFGIPNSEYIVRVDNNTGKALSCYNQDTGTEYIGEGDSDFSTAEVMVIAPGGFHAMLPIIIDIEDHAFTSVANDPENGTFLIPLYKGMAVITVLDPKMPTPTVSGDITWNPDEQVFFVRGNGTITIS